MEKVQIGKKLLELRKNISITQKVISDYLNIKVNTYSQYENNIRQPDYNTLQKIANYYDVSVDYLFDFEKAYKLMDIDLLYKKYKRENIVISKIFEENKNNVDEEDIFKKLKKLKHIKDSIVSKLEEDEFKDFKAMHLK